MADKQSRLDAAFLDRQRRRLTALREQMLQVGGGRQSERGNVNAELSGQAREFEDDAQKLASLELQDDLEAADEERLSNIERALKKIDDGTYGLSDSSGEAVDIDRLEATPEALYTLEEQKSRDAAR